MRFDEERAVSLAKRLDFPRAAGSDGERRAADLIAAELARAGLEVERHPLIGSRFPEAIAPRLGWIGVAALATASTILAPLGLPEWAQLVLLGAAWLLLLSGPDGVRFGRGLPPRCPSELVEGHRPAVEPPVRVVFLSRLDAPGGGWSLRSRLFFWLLFFGLWANLNVLNLGKPLLRHDLILQVILWVGLIGIYGGFLLTHARPSRSSPLRGLWLDAIFLAVMGIDFAVCAYPAAMRPAAWALLGLLWIAALLRCWEPRGAGGPVGSDNALGLATLAELARTWPKSAVGRIEARFVAVGGGSLGQAGLRTLVGLSREVRPSRPTLIVNLQGIGGGPMITLVGRGRARRLAVSAAKDLWIPHVVRTRAPVSDLHAPLARRGWDTITLLGERYYALPSARFSGGITLAAPPVPPRAVAQLATEIALRWAREERERAQPSAESLARSSQKPG